MPVPLAMNLDVIDWSALERLRAAFLDGTAGRADYWQSESDLASYDVTFAQRIGWKWDYVLAELARRGWVPPRGELLDWGCGSGIAHRVFLDHFSTDPVTRVHLWDRSPLAMRFAAGRARQRFPTLPISSSLIEAPAIFLLSHVVNELEPEATQKLVEMAARATALIWVEPGNYECSLALIAVRERLRGRMNVIAPCTHVERCGMLAPGNERHWCHHFAPSPPEAFTDGDWARFANLAGIDLGSLPVSFLVLDQRPAPTLPLGAMRVIGSPRVHKPHALIFGCDARGVAERRLTKRRLPQEYRACKKAAFDVLQDWNCAEDEVLSTSPLARHK